MVPNLSEDFIEEFGWLDLEEGEMLDFLIIGCWADNRFLSRPLKRVLSFGRGWGGKGVWTSPVMVVVEGTSLSTSVPFILCVEMENLDYVDWVGEWDSDCWEKCLRCKTIEEYPWSLKTKFKSQYHSPSESSLSASVAFNLSFWEGSWRVGVASSEDGLAHLLLINDASSSSEVIREGIVCTSFPFEARGKKR